jgi:hypothetical protein
MEPWAHHFDNFVRPGAQEDFSSYLTEITFQEAKSDKVNELTLVITLRNKKQYVDIPPPTFGKEFSWMM